MDNSQDFQQMWRFGFDEVYDALLAAVTEAGLKVKSSDRNLGRVSASAGMSLTSWGEELSFSLEDEGEKRTRLRLTSAAKVGANIASRSRHAKHFDAVLKSMSQRLGSNR